MPLPHLLSSRHLCGEQKESGIPIEEARRRIFLFDSKGLVVADRKAGGLNSQKMRYAHKHGACTAAERLRL
jgi:malic enzyme